MTNQRASRVSFFVVVALAVLAVGAPVPKALAAQHETRCCVLDDHTHQLACAQYTSDHCSAVGGIDIGPGSCSHNPCTSATTTTAPSTTTTTSTATTSSSTSTSTSTTSTSTSSSTSTTLACCGFSPQPGRLRFTTGIGSGNCGMLLDSAGADLLNLSCGSLYNGGGNKTLPPYVLPGMGQAAPNAAAHRGPAL